MSTAETFQARTAPPALHVTLESRPESARHARHLADEYLRGLPGPEGSLHPDVVDAVVLVVSELITNAVRHADGPSCCLRLSACPEAIAIAVGDASHVPPRPRIPDAAGEGGGFGWAMICEIADAVCVNEEPDGKTVNAVVPRDRRRFRRAT